MSAPRYHSETRSVPVPQLPPDLRNALIMHADKKKLRLVGTRAWLTHRANAATLTRLQKLFGRGSSAVDADASHDMVLVLHATHLFFASSGVVRGTSAHSITLALATLVRGNDRAAEGADVPDDDGLRIGGFPSGDEASGYFMGLGAGAEADACVLASMAAVNGAKS